MVNSFEVYNDGKYAIVKDIKNKRYLRIKPFLISNVIQKSFVLPESYNLHMEECFSRHYISKRKNEIVVFKIKNLDKYFARLLPHLPRSIFSFSICLIVIVFSICIAVITNYYFRSTEYFKTNIIFNMIWLIVNVLIHELGHAFICSSYKREVIEGGLKLHYGLPVIYMNTTDICMADKKSRIHTSLAGIYGNALLLIIAFIILLCLGYNPFTYKMIINLPMAFILFNAIPFLKLDGYYIFSDIININNLNKKARESIVEILRIGRITKRMLLLCCYYIANLMFMSWLLFILIKVLFQKFIT